MDILKPEYLSLTSQPLDWRGKMHHALTVGFGFTLTDGTPMKAEEAWGAAMQGLASGFCVDTGVPKKQAEWLLSGAVCAPAQGGTIRPIHGLLASCAVGQSRREWLASGEHTGREVAPFTEMPLIWANTWGGPASPDNPLGCGLEPDARGVLRTPTITEKDALSHRPACPGPMGAWPCRMKNMGTYDDEWLQKRWPGVPDDFDWTFFNLAQPAQRLAEGLHGGEQLELRNLHPAHPRLSLTAPAQQIKIEIQRAGESAWSELAAIRDTLWLFPGQLTGLYLWHALATCKDEAASDIAAVRLTLTPEIAEPVAEVPPPDLAAAANAGAGAAGAAAESVGGKAVVVGAAGVAAAALGATLLAGAGSPSRAAEKNAEAPHPVPAEPAPPKQDAPQKDTSPQPQPGTKNREAATSAAPFMSSVTATALADLDSSIGEINDALHQSGLPPLTPEQIQETRERIIKTSGAISEVMDRPNPDLNTVLQQAGIPQDRIAAVNTVLDMDMPSREAHPTEAAWNAACEDYVARFTTLMQPSEKDVQRLRTVLGFAGPAGEAAVKAALPPAPSNATLLARTGLDPALLAAELDALDTETLPGLNDMNGLAARAVALEQRLGLPPESVAGRIRQLHVFMKEKNMLPPQTGPAGAVAPAATAGHTPLHPEGSAAQEKQAAQVAGQETTQPEKTSQEKVLPGKDSQETASQEKTLQQKTLQEKASPSDAPKSRGDVLLLLALGVPLAGLVFAGLQLDGLDFSGKDLRGARFDNAQLRSANFTGADVTGGSFVGADLSGADLTNATLASASFAGATATDASFAGAGLAGAALTGANCHGADFGNANLQGVDATGSVLDRASFYQTDLGGGNFSRASFNRADFHAANAEGAVFTQADMTNTSLGFGTTVAGADFSGACLAGGAWDGVTATGSTFSRVSADNAGFVGCDFTDTSWKAARGRSADFSRTTFNRADMRGADLFRASLRESGVETANLSGANLYNADLYRLRTSPMTTMDGADITATILDARSKKLS